MKEVTILSLGAGVQSTALALMLDAGEPGSTLPGNMLPGHRPPDAAVFADTRAEPPWVYTTVEQLEERLSYPVIRTSYSDLEQDTLATLRREATKKRPAQTAESIFLDIPSYIGNTLPLRPTTRRCTADYKIAAIRRAVRERFGWPIRVQMYLGISADEIVRVKDSRVQYITNRYPLVDQRLTRNDCELWLKQNHPGMTVGRSACFFCPYHSTAEWLNIADNAPDLYARALEMDDRLGELSPPQRLNSHGSLREVVDAARRQGKLDFTVPGDECEGVCMV